MLGDEKTLTVFILLFVLVILLAVPLNSHLNSIAESLRNIAYSLRFYEKMRHRSDDDHQDPWQDDKQ